MLLTFLNSCGTFIFPFSDQKKDVLIIDYQKMGARDYADHLHSLKRPFLNTPGVKTIRVPKSVQQYLDRLILDIISKNEIFFKELKRGEVTILDMETPLHLSLPHGEIFLSKGLLLKYIKHESVLVSILSYELVRSEKWLYPKETIIPVGYLPLERIVLLNRLGPEEKMEVHKWAFHLTVRAGYDGDYYLSWLQTQNRNTADFVFLVGDVNQINREEALFKAFLIKHPVEDTALTKRNSSKSFYRLLNAIQDEGR